MAFSSSLHRFQFFLSIFSHHTLLVILLFLIFLNFFCLFCFGSICIYHLSLVSLRISFSNDSYYLSPSHSFLSLLLFCTHSLPFSLAPDVLVLRPYNHKVDCWAIGVITFILWETERLCCLVHTSFFFLFLERGRWRRRRRKKRWLMKIKERKRAWSIFIWMRLTLSSSSSSSSSFCCTYLLFLTRKSIIFRANLSLSHLSPFLSSFRSLSFPHLSFPLLLPSLSPRTFTHISH